MTRRKLLPRHFPNKLTKTINRIFWGVYVFLACFGVHQATGFWKTGVSQLVQGLQKQQVDHLYLAER
jgi:hypothetical protein